MSAPVQEKLRDQGGVWDTLHLLYRGPLSSCNYDCGYCPFAKHRSPPEELFADRVALERFTNWVIDEAKDRRVAILFTPWGEGLVRAWYRAAMTRLSHADNVAKVAIQTNLSAPLGWLADVDRDHLGLWVTYHPSEVAYDRFLERCRRLLALGVRFSVGLVGLAEHLDAAEALRRDLPDEVYVWVNAYKDHGPGYYAPDLLDRFTRVDPMFPLNTVDHPSLGQACHAGSRAFSVDGDGDVRRCHFVKAVVGNIYRDPVDKWGGASPCPEATCGCHIGYVHLASLGQYDAYGDGLMERIPRPEARGLAPRGTGDDRRQPVDGPPSRPPAPRR